MENRRNDETENEIGVSFSPISTPAQTRTDLPFSELIGLYLSKSKEVEIAEINYRLLPFLPDAQADTIYIVCIPSSFVGERGVAHPTPEAEKEPKRYKQEEQKLLETLKQMNV